MFTVPTIIESEIHGDVRGFFIETYRGNEYIQENWSRSFRGVIRGLHYQEGCAKLIRVVRGCIFDVAVNLETGEYKCYELSDLNCRALFIPAGYAHGFQVLSDVADVVYKVTKEYDPKAEGSIRWDSLGIPWPIKEAIISKRDREAKEFKK